MEEDFYCSFRNAEFFRNLFNETHIYRRSAANAAILVGHANCNPPRTLAVEGSINF